MKEFILEDTNRFFLPGTGNRFLHLASLTKGLREFMCFADKYTEKIYIEEVTGGQLQFIEDDSLVESIMQYLTDKGILQAANPTLPDSIWHPTNKTKKIFI